MGLLLFDRTQISSAKAKMIHNSKVMRFCSPILQDPPTTTVAARHRWRPNCSSSSPPTISTSTSTQQHLKLSRRGLGNSSLLVLLASYETLLELPKARAEDKNERCSDEALTKQAFLDISIDREPAGRIVIGLYGKQAPGGAARFSSLVSGAAGVTYRRKEFVKVTPKYVQHGGVRSFGVDAELASKELSAQSLVDEWERQRGQCPGTRNLAGTVGIVVRDPSQPPPKMKLVARQGKLQIDEEPVGAQPNGTEFVITFKDSPELDESVLVIGKVLLGMEVADTIGLVKTVQDNTTSPYFRVAKLIGDKRAVVAERGFNRPYSKVQVTNCGLLE